MIKFIAILSVVATALTLSSTPVMAKILLVAAKRAELATAAVENSSVKMAQSVHPKKHVSKVCYEKVLKTPWYYICCIFWYYGGTCHHH